MPDDERHRERLPRHRAASLRAGAAAPDAPHTTELIAQWGFELDGNARVGGLRTADKQKVEILRAVACDARVIVMDEPTSSLTSVETSGFTG